MKQADYSCSHPLFQYSSRGAWHELRKNVAKPVVFIFEKPVWITPTPEQIAVYRLSRKIVEELGGSMNERECEIGGKSSPLNTAEVRSILAAVRRDNPTAKIIDYWNGKGSYTMSVGVDMAPK